MRRYKAVTLFEMMLVLVIIAVIMLGFYEFQSRVSQENAGDRLAYKLYQFGTAVNAFTRIYENSYCTGRKPLVFYGYQWLQIKNPLHPEEMILDPRFDFNMKPLGIGPMDDQGAVVMTTLHCPLNAAGVPELKLEKITLGIVSVPASAGEQGPTHAMKPALALATKAAAIASDYRDQDGSARINYYVDMNLDQGEINPEAHIVGVLKQTQSAADEWLRVDGSNPMQGDIQFRDNQGLAFSDKSRVTQMRVTDNYTTEGANKKMTPSASSLCYLTTVKVKTIPQKCYIEEGDESWVLKNEGEGHCAARCLVWN